ncbi:MAG: discoidin domain-containing protein [Candidatus Omnitrophota bacterium]
MKRIMPVIIVMLSGIFCYPALAKDKALSLSVSASSTADSEQYAAGMAVDKDTSTYWLGDSGAAGWWVEGDAGDVRQIKEITILWSAQDNTPQTYDILTSTDGVVWNSALTNVPGLYQPGGQTNVITQKARYVKLNIGSMPLNNAPGIKELEAAEKVTVPRLIHFQAALGDADKTPLTGDYTLTFRLYDTASGGVPLWEETQSDVAVEGGRVDVELGSVTVLDIAFDQQYWLGVEVGNDGEMTPRFKLTSAPYALTAEE